MKKKCEVWETCTRYKSSVCKDCHKEGLQYYYGDQQISRTVRTMPFQNEDFVSQDCQDKWAYLLKDVPLGTEIIISISWLKKNKEKQ